MLSVNQCIASHYFTQQFAIPHIILKIDWFNSTKMPDLFNNIRSTIATDDFPKLISNKQDAIPCDYWLNHHELIKIPTKKR